MRGRIEHPRIAPVPLETSAILAEPDGDGLLVHLSTQSVHGARSALAAALGMPEETIRVIAPDVGGGFGPKLETLVEHVCVAHAARLLGRPVRYMETRSESMVALPHGRGQVQRFAIGARRDGTITGLDVDLLVDLGGYPLSPYVGSMSLPMLSGAYAIPAIRARIRSVVTNATPTAPLRGAGRPEAAALVERAVDLLAAELGLDPVTVRRRNLIGAASFPFRTAVDSLYDSGDYEQALDRALVLADYDGARLEQAARRARGDRRLLGVGVACYVEITTFGRPEHASVTVVAHRYARRRGRCLAAGAGPRDDVRPGGLGHARRPDGTHQRRALRHRPRAARARDVRFSLAAGGWIGRRRRRPGRRRAGAHARSGHARGRPRRRRARRRPLPRARGALAVVHAGRHRGRGRRPVGRARLRAGRVDVPVRLPRRRGRGRLRHGRPPRPAAGRGRRRRPRREPAADGGPGARRHRPGSRAGAVRARSPTTPTARR